MLGCVMQLQSIPNPLGLLWLKRRVQGCGCMRTQVIQHHYDLVRIRKMHIDQLLHTLCPIDRSALVSHLDVPPVVQRREEQEQIADAVTLERTLEALRLARLNREWRDHLDMLLFVALIEADERTFGIERPRVDIKHIFHRGDEGGIGFGWDLPLLLQPRLKFVFFSVRRTVSGAILSTTPSATSLSASKTNVQRSAPSGGAPQARATSWASCAPSSLRRDGPAHFLRYSAASRPAVTKARRTRSTVGTLTDTASAIAASLQAGASGAVSALSRMRAWVWEWAEALPLRIRASRVWRCSVVSSTRYFLFNVGLL